MRRLRPIRFAKLIPAPAADGQTPKRRGVASPRLLVYGPVRVGACPGL